MKSPRVISPARIARPPTTSMTMETPPKRIVVKAETPLTAVIVEATLRSRRCTPLVKVSSSRFSAV